MKKIIVRHSAWPPKKIFYFKSPEKYKNTEYIEMCNTKLK